MNSAQYTPVTEDINGNPRQNPRTDVLNDPSSMGEVAQSFFVQENFDAFDLLAHKFEKEGLIKIIQNNHDGSIIVELYPEKIDTNQAALPIHQEIPDNEETQLQILGDKEENLMLIDEPVYSEKLKERVRNIPLKVQEEFITKLAKKPAWLPVVMRMTRMGHQVPGWTLETTTDTVGVFFEIPRPIETAPISLGSKEGLQLLDPFNQLGADIAAAFVAVSAPDTMIKITSQGNKDLLGLLRDAKTEWNLNLLPTFCEESETLLGDLFLVEHDISLDKVDLNNHLVTEFLMSLLLNSTYKSIVSVSDSGLSAVVKTETDTEWPVDYLSENSNYEEKEEFRYD